METQQRPERSGSVPPLTDVARIERALGWRPTQFRRADERRGTSDTSARWIVGDGRTTAFVKVGATALTAEWTRAEHRNYGALEGWFMPRVLGFDDDGSRPVLALEDLSRASWPPPWSDARVVAVLDALTAIRRTAPPAHLLGQSLDLGSNWREVADDPAPFLDLGLCSPAWLEASLGALIAAASDASIDGTSLLHLDVRSDNLCFRDGRAILLDWNAAGIGNAEIDVAFWLPSLHAEGGPAPEAVLPSSPELAALVSGFFCSRAGSDAIPEAPHVRPLQVQQARTALPWAARALRLPAP
jgi:hypothetical protein